MGSIHLSDGVDTHNFFVKAVRHAAHEVDKNICIFTHTQAHINLHADLHQMGSIKGGYD